MKKLLLLFLLLVPLHAQNYVVQKTTALSSAFEAITVDAPGTSGTPGILRFQKAYVDCSAACTITLFRSGTFPTSLALLPVNVNKTDHAVRALAFSSSDSTGGVTLGVYTLGAGGSIVIDLSNINFRLDSANSTGDNITLKTNTISATVNIIIAFSETDIG